MSSNLTLSASCKGLDGLIPDPGFHRLPVEFLCVPFLFWAAFRLGLGGVATCVLVLSVIAIHGALGDLGPFARESAKKALLLLQAYLAVQSVIMLSAAAVPDIHRRLSTRPAYRGRCG